MSALAKLAALGWSGTTGSSTPGGGATGGNNTTTNELFSAYPYTGTGAVQSISAGVDLSSTSGSQEAYFTTPGTYQWTCPLGVTSICVAAVGGGGSGAAGGGGGGGGGLVWKNNIAVVPGQTYTVIVGAGGGGKGGDSSFNTTIIARGGNAGIAGGNGGTGGTYSGGDGGFNGGNGGATYGGNQGGGGGGAATFSSNGGDATTTTNSGGIGGSSGGAGRGGGGNGNGGGGGGIYLYGLPNTGGVGPTPGNNVAGAGGSYGGGGGGGEPYYGSPGAAGAGGAVRIIWGSGRSFPSNAAQLPANGMTGGLVIARNRSATGTGPMFYDTMRGVSSGALQSSSNSPAGTSASNKITSFDVSGFTLDGVNNMNTSGSTYIAYCFKRAPKFFDIVTWVGDGQGDRAIPHQLGTMPGLVMAKAVSQAGEWYVNHRTFGLEYMLLNSTAGSQATGAPAAIGMDANNIYVHQYSSPWLLNQSGVTYVAYIFGHDTTSTGLIQCGSLTVSSGRNDVVDLGWEAQFVMTKTTNSPDGWRIWDTARGMDLTQQKYYDFNTTAAEGNTTGWVLPHHQGFQLGGSGYNAAAKVIYMAIRIPTAVPSAGTQVHKSIAYSGDNSNGRKLSGAGFLADMVLMSCRKATVNNQSKYIYDRKRGLTPGLSTTGSSAEDNVNVINSFDTDGITINYNGNTRANGTGNTYVAHLFKRAPRFFDEVCYTGSGVADTLKHNLQAVPNLIITKSRNQINDWGIAYSEDGVLGFCESEAGNLRLNSSNGAVQSITWGQSNTATDTTFRTDVGGYVNNIAAGVNYTAWLFATLAGVSKVGRYFGDGSVTGKTIDCGFANGARFLMIKRVNGGGDWMIWDAARGITSVANDVVWDTPGIYDWVCPEGVTSISILCVGAGADGQNGGGYGGGGGALTYANNKTVVPGQTYTVIVPAGNSGTAARFQVKGSTTLCSAGSAVGPAGGATGVGNGGGGGGSGKVGNYAGGGGAGGYSGAGGDGGYNYSVSPTNGNGGAGAGGGSAFVNNSGGGGGGGVGIFGVGANGAINAVPGPWGTDYGSAASGGGGGSGGYNGTKAGQQVGGDGGWPGGGGGSGMFDQNGSVWNTPGKGAGGVVRIMLNGATSQFPSTNVSGPEPYYPLNSSNTAEVSTTDTIDPTSVGFKVKQNTTTNANLTGAEYIYLAIA